MDWRLRNEGFNSMALNVMGNTCFCLTLLLPGTLPHTPAACPAYVPAVLSSTLACPAATCPAALLAREAAAAGYQTSPHLPGQAHKGWAVSACNRQVVEDDCESECSQACASMPIP
jgi:hypothetical protein